MEETFGTTVKRGGKYCVAGAAVFVEGLKDVLFSTPLEDFHETMRHHESLVPEPLSHKFQERLTQKAAVDKWKAKKRTVAECFPPVNEQLKMQETRKAQKQANEKTNAQQQKRAPCCRKCNLPMKGHCHCHPRGHCQSNEATL
eukprot:gene2434-18088_t